MGAQHEQMEEATVRVWKRAQDVRRWHTTLEDMDWNDSDTLEYIKRLAKASVKEEEQNRLMAWQEKWTGATRMP